MLSALHSFGLPRLSPKEIIRRSACGAFYYRYHWTLTRPNGFKTPVHTHPVFCPACRKIRERFPSGELRLLGIEPVEKQEFVRILRNEEERAREKNPLERIMRLEEAKGNWKIETTTEKLAQRLGRSVKKREAATSGVTTTNSSEWFGKKEQIRPFEKRYKVNCSHLLSWIRGALYWPETGGARL